VAGGAAQVEESSFGKDDDTVAVWEFESVALGFDVDSLDAWVVLETFHVDFVIEMSDVSNNSVVFHLGHVVGHDDIFVACAGDVEISFLDDRLDSLDIESFHACLEGTDWVNFGNNNSGTGVLESRGAAFADITVAEDNTEFTSKHNISGSVDSIDDGVSATVDVVELGFGNAVVNVDGSDEEFSFSGHLIKSVDSGGGFFRAADEFL